MAVHESRATLTRSHRGDPTVAASLDGGDATRRRRLQIALGLVWLVDAALQYQPFMFTRAFVTEIVEPAATGAPRVVAVPATWSAHLMLRDIGVANAFFATIQLLIAVALLYRPWVRLGLAASFTWSLGIWVLAEGIGGITSGASPIAGAPGAALLYAVLSVLLWPPRGVAPGRSSPGGRSVAESGVLGSFVPRCGWGLLWAGFAALTLENANRASNGLHDAVTGMADGEPGWVGAMDRALARPLAHHGGGWSFALAALFVLVAVPVLVGRAVRPVLALAVLLAVAIWLAEDFGAVLTGSGTDVNTGPLLVLLAVAFWPPSTQRPGRYPVGDPGPRS